MFELLIVGAVAAVAAIVIELEYKWRDKEEDQW